MSQANFQSKTITSSKISQRLIAMVQQVMWCVRWNVHCVWNVGPRKQLNLYKHGNVILANCKFILPGASVFGIFSDMVCTVINESARPVSEYALRCECGAKKTVQSL